jgi:hypothetical protein
MKANLVCRSLLLGLTLWPSLARAAGPTIEPRPVGCVEAGRFPRLAARIAPAAEIATVRLFFRAQGTPHWYSVAMTPEGDLFTGILPQPKRGLKGIDYFIDATDRTDQRARTAELTAIVVERPAQCPAGAPVAAAMRRGPPVKPLAAGVGAPGALPGFGGDGLLGRKTLLIGGAALSAAGGGYLAFRTRPNSAPTVGGISVSPASVLMSVTSVEFEAQGVADRDGDALTYVWDFGDGSQHFGPKVQHVYSSAGPFPVRLAVSDSKSSPATAMASVIVRSLTGVWGGSIAETAPTLETHADFARRGVSLGSAVVVDMAQAGERIEGSSSERSDAGEGRASLKEGYLYPERGLAFSLWFSGDWCVAPPARGGCEAYEETWSGTVTPDLGRLTGTIQRDGHPDRFFDLRRRE